MYRIIENRSTGKTRKLMEYAKEAGATFVCSNPLAMASKAYNYGITGLSFVSYADYFKRVNKNESVVIDELESFILSLDKNILGYSLTAEG